MIYLNTHYREFKNFKFLYLFYTCMKKLVAILSIFLLPCMAIWDVLPEPEIFNNDLDEKIQDEEIQEEIVWETQNNTMTYDTDNQINTVASNSWAKNDSWIDDDSSITNTNNNFKWLAAIEFWFCNEWTDNLSSNLNYAVNIWQPFKVCALFHNKSNQDITIHVDIVDGATSAQWDKTCDFSSTNIQNFINKADIKDLENVVIPAGDFLIKEFELTFPIWLEWTQSACYTYYIPNENGWSMISTIITNWSFMDFFVWSLGDIKNEIITEDIKTYLNSNNELNLDFVLSNIWNLENTIKIEWSISNIFWFKRDFSLDWKELELNAWASTPVSIQLWSLPNYWGLFNIKFTVTSTPFFSYDISKSDIDPSLLEDKIFTVTTTFSQMPWLIFILVVMFIIILILLFRKPKK